MKSRRRACCALWLHPNWKGKQTWADLHQTPPPPPPTHTRWPCVFLQVGLICWYLKRASPVSGHRREEVYLHRCCMSEEQSPSAGCLQVPDTLKDAASCASSVTFCCWWLVKWRFVSGSVEVCFESRSRTWSLMPWATHQAMRGGIKIEERRGRDRWICSCGIKKKNKRTTTPPPPLLQLPLFLNL